MKADRLRSRPAPDPENRSGGAPATATGHERADTPGRGAEHRDVRIVRGLTRHLGNPADEDER